MKALAWVWLGMVAVGILWGIVKLYIWSEFWRGFILIIVCDATLFSAIALTVGAVYVVRGKKF